MSTVQHLLGVVVVLLLLAALLYTARLYLSKVSGVPMEKEVGRRKRRKYAPVVDDDDLEEL